MKKCALSLAALVLGLVCLTTPAAADRGHPVRRVSTPRPPVPKQIRPPVPPQGQSPSKGGNGGDTAGKGSKGGNGGGAVAIGGNGGNAGPGGQGGNGGNATAINGNNNTVINGNVTIIAGSKGNRGPFPGGFGKGRKKFGPGFGGGFSSGGDSGGGDFGGGSGSGGPAGPGVGGTGVATAGVGGAGETAGEDGKAVGIDGADGGVLGGDGADAVTLGKDGADSLGEKSVPQTKRFLQVKNDSDVPYTVMVQYRSKTEDGLWVWVPAAPEESQKALRFPVAPSQALYLEVNGKRLATSRVRLWAVSAKKSWNEYRTTDLWLVPETDANGEHVYLAPEVGTFTFIIPRAEMTAKTE